MEIQDAKQARPHCELIAELLDSRQPKTEREHAAVREIERLRHDIERHIAIASEHATECERLRAELATEHRRQSTMRTLIAALEGTLSHYRSKQAEADEAVRTLGSEREANATLTAELAARDSTIEALLDFAGTVAPGASWWDDVWPEHESAIAARKGEGE